MQVAAVKRVMKNDLQVRNPHEVRFEHFMGIIILLSANCVCRHRQRECLILLMVGGL